MVQYAERQQAEREIARAIEESQGIPETLGGRLLRGVDAVRVRIARGLGRDARHYGAGGADVSGYSEPFIRDSEPVIRDVGVVSTASEKLARIEELHTHLDSARNALHATGMDPRFPKISKPAEFDKIVDLFGSVNTEKLRLDDAVETHHRNIKNVAGLSSVPSGDVLQEGLQSAEAQLKKIHAHLDSVRDKYGIDVRGAEHSAASAGGAPVAAVESTVNNNIAIAKRSGMGKIADGLSSGWEGAKSGVGKGWGAVKTLGKWGGIATAGVVAVGFLLGKRESQARRSQDELNNQELATLRAEAVSPMVGANTLMGMEPVAGAHAARVRGGAEQGALNPPVDRSYQVVS